MRLDVYLVKNNFYPTRAIAQESIKNGRVQVKINDAFKIIKKPGIIVDEFCKVEVEDETFWVSRAAKKIESAFSLLDIDVEAMHVLDLGQSTGGFTDFFLKQGALKVTGVDVGKDQLHKKLRDDPRVECFEGRDARDLSFLKDHNFEFFSVDLSFISLLKVAPEIKSFFGEKSVSGVFLVKPQFEVGKVNVDKGGIVKKWQVFIDCQKMIVEGLEGMGFRVLNYIPSQIRGKNGNQEFICHVNI